MRNFQLLRVYTPRHIPTFAAPVNLTNINFILIQKTIINQAIERIQSDDNDDDDEVRLRFKQICSFAFFPF